MEMEEQKKRKMLAAIIGLIIILSSISAGIYLFYSGHLPGNGSNVIPYPDSDNDGVPDSIENQLGTDSNNPNDAKYGTLFYDPSGSNYGSPTTRSEGDAYLLLDNNEVIYVSLSQQFDLSNPLIMDGFFELGDDNTILSHQQDLIFENETETQNADLDLTNCVAGCFYNHTIGFGMVGNTKVFFISLIKAPALFVNLSLSGVFINISKLTSSNILDIDIPNEITSVIDSFDIEEVLGARIFVGGAISYADTETITGDVLDIFTPKDAVTLAQALPFGLKADKMNSVTGFLSHIDMHILVLMEDGSNANAFNLWFIVVPSNYDTGAYDGLVTIPVAEADLSSVFPTAPSGYSWLDLHVGSTNYVESQPVYTQKSVTGLWTLLENSVTEAVEVRSYALIITVEEVIEAIGGAFEMDLSILTDLTAFRNPAFALLVDYNITGYFSNNIGLKEYMVLALIPDANPDLGLFARLDCPGVLYNLGDFLNLDLDFPVIFCDKMMRDDISTLETNLGSIRNDAANAVNDQFMTHVNVSGSLLGVSLKSVAKYTQFIDPIGISTLMSNSPLDVGVYDLKDSDDGTTYHLATIYPKIGVAPNCLFRPAYVQGYYLNFNYAWAYLSGSPETLARKSSGSEAFSDGIFVRSINNLFSALGIDSVLLDGILIADNIVLTTRPNYFTFTEVEHFVVEDESCVVPAVIGHTQFHGSISANVWVTAEFKGSDGTSMFMKCKMQKDGGLFDGFSFTPFIDGSKGRFLLANGTKYLPADTYNVNIDITGWTPSSLFLGGEPLGNYNYQLDVLKDYIYDELDINPNSNNPIPVSDGYMYRSLGYLNDNFDWYSINLEQKDLLRVKYYNIHDANVEVTLYDPDGYEIATTDWSWATTLIKVAQKTGTYKIEVEYDLPGIYCLEIASIMDDDNNNFADAENISISQNFNYTTSGTVYVEDGVTLSDRNDYYSVYLRRGQYIYVWYENLGGTGIFGDANVELFLYNSNYDNIDDTWLDLSTNVEGFATEDGLFFLRIYRDTEDGFYKLSYYIKNGTPNLDSLSSIEVEDGDIVNGWLQVTPSDTMEHWYKIYVFANETITVEMWGDVEMWLFAGATEVDTTDWSLKTTVSHTASSNNWYYLGVLPDTDTNYTLKFSVT